MITPRALLAYKTDILLCTLYCCCIGWTCGPQLDNYTLTPVIFFYFLAFPCIDFIFAYFLLASSQPLHFNFSAINQSSCAHHVSSVS